METLVSSDNQISYNNLSVFGHLTQVKLLEKNLHTKIFEAYDSTCQEAVIVKIFDWNQTFDKKRLEKSVDILRSITHKNIIGFKEFLLTGEVCDSNGTTMPISVLVMENGEEGELYKLIRNCTRLQENLARTFFSQLLDALEHLHAQDIVHRDIKLENIVLTRDYCAKLIDFDFSARICPGENFEDKIGTHLYHAPEIHSQTPYDPRDADIFAAGIVLFAMVIGHMPFGRACQADGVYRTILNGDLRRFWTLHERVYTRNSGEKWEFEESFQDLINKIFASDPKQRLTIQGIRSHIWMQRETLSSEDIVTMIQKTLSERREV